MDTHLHAAETGTELDPSHQLRNRHFQCFGENFDVSQRYVPYSPFDAADVRTIQSAVIRKSFLRKTAFLPQFAYTFAKSKENTVASNHHGRAD